MPLFRRNDERGNTETNYKKIKTNRLRYQYFKLWLVYMCNTGGRKLRKEMLILTYILPRSKGELMIREIYKCLCVHCNRSKGNKTDNTKADLKHRKQNIWGISTLGII